MVYGLIVSAYNVNNPVQSCLARSLVNKQKPWQEVASLSLNRGNWMIKRCRAKSIDKRISLRRAKTEIE